MFEVYDKNRKSVVVYAVRENQKGELQFLIYFGEWEWYDADNFISANTGTKSKFTPKTSEEAATVLRDSILTDDKLYNVLLTRIKSALEDCEYIDCPFDGDLYENGVVKFIADRIIEGGK